MPLIVNQDKAATLFERSLVYTESTPSKLFDRWQKRRPVEAEAPPWPILAARHPLPSEQKKASAHNETRIEEKHEEQHSHLHALRKGTIAFVAVLGALVALFLIFVVIFLIMWKIKKAFKRPERGNQPEPGTVMELNPRESTSRRQEEQSQEGHPHYETVSQRLARQQAQASTSHATMAPPSSYRPPEGMSYYPVSPPRPPQQWERVPLHSSLERLSTNVSSFTDFSLSPSSAATSMARSYLPTPTTMDDGQTYSSHRTLTKSPVAEALLNESFDLTGGRENDASFDWDRCTFQEQEEEAMWLPGDDTFLPAYLSGRRRSASAPVPYEPTNEDKSLPATPQSLALPPSPLHRLPKQSSDTFAGYSMTPKHSRGPMCHSPSELLPPPASPTSRQSLRFALPDSPSETSQHDPRPSRLRQMSSNTEPGIGQGQSPSSPVSPPGYTGSLRSLYIVQPSPALSSPAHDSGFRVLSRGPSSPATASLGRSEPYTEPPSPAFSIGSQLDSQRSTNELRFAGAQAIRELSIHRAASSHALSTPPLHIVKKKGIKSSASSVFQIQPSKERSPSQLSLFLPRKNTRRSRPTTAETTPSLAHSDEDLEEVVPDCSLSQLPYDIDMDTSKSVKYARRHCRLRSGRSRPATADSAPTWSSGTNPIVFA